MQDKGGYNDDFGDSDNEAVPDAYLERVKAEAQERDLDDGDSDESTDEDFNPNQAESDVAEEYDSDPDTSSDEGDSEGGGDSGKINKLGFNVLFSRSYCFKRLIFFLNLECLEKYLESFLKIRISPESLSIYILRDFPFFFYLRRF